ncbi:MAG: hypothetical protein R3F61_30025 [Myxococcota bacterium]
MWMVLGLVACGTRQEAPVKTENPQVEHEAEATLEPGPWSIAFADGSGNLTRIWRDADAAVVGWQYVPVTPEESSSGTYSGGEPGSGEVDAAGAEALWAELRRLQADPAVHAETRSMGTGHVSMTTESGEQTVLLEMKVTRDLAKRIAALRQPSVEAHGETD